MKCKLLDLGLQNYENIHFLQQKLVDSCRKENGENVLLLLEHPSIFTIGRASSLENLLCSKEVLRRYGIEVRYVDRGGDITFHGAGQLVAYPIFNLREYKCDLHKYLRALEKVVIETLKMYNLKADRIDGRTGVWVEDKKISSIGIGVKGWITYHGLSLNVNLDLTFFSLVNPCGLKGIQMTSLKELLRKEIPMDEIKSRIIQAFKDVFCLEVLN